MCVCIYARFVNAWVLLCFPWWCQRTASASTTILNLCDMRVAAIIIGLPLCSVRLRHRRYYNWPTLYAFPILATSPPPPILPFSSAICWPSRRTGWKTLKYETYFKHEYEKFCNVQAEESHVVFGFLFSMSFPEYNLCSLSVYFKIGSF